jgi:hypothetical protein
MAADSNKLSRLHVDNGVLLPATIDVRVDLVEAHIWESSCQMHQEVRL